MNAVINPTPRPEHAVCALNTWRLKRSEFLNNPGHADILGANYELVVDQMYLDLGRHASFHSVVKTWFGAAEGRTGNYYSLFIS
jgi:hypothetical protein